MAIPDVRAGEVRIGEVAALQINAIKIGSTKIGQCQIRGIEIGSIENGMREIRANVRAIMEVHPIEIYAREPFAAQIDAGAYKRLVSTKPPGRDEGCITMFNVGRSRTGKVGHQQVCLVKVCPP